MDYQRAGFRGLGAMGSAGRAARDILIGAHYNSIGFVKGEGFPGPGNIEIHYNSTGFVKGKGKRKILQSTPGPGIHYNSIGFVKGRR